MSVPVPYVVGLAYYGDPAALVIVVSRESAQHAITKPAPHPETHHAILGGVDIVAKLRLPTDAPVEVYVCQKSVAQACARALEGRGDVEDDARAALLRSANVTVHWRARTDESKPGALSEALKIADARKTSAVRRPGVAT